MYVENAIQLSCYYKPIADDPHERRHAEIYNNLKNLPYPFDFEIAEIAPKFKFNELLTFSSVGHKEIKTLSFSLSYQYRFNGHINGELNLGNYDRLDIKFRYSQKAIDYKKCLYELYPLIIQGYGGYRAKLLFRDLWFDYRRQYEEVRKKLREKEGLDFDGTNNIFTLCPAQYWSDELCHKALGYSAEEAIARLKKAGAHMAEPLLDGVYSVLNDDRNINLEAYTEMNIRFKTALGLYDGTIPRKKLFGLI